MEKGSLSIEQIIIIVICLLVLILSIIFLTRMTGPAGNTTITTAELYSECSNWRLFGNSEATFTKAAYPALWRTYVRTSQVPTATNKNPEPTDEEKKQGYSMAKSFCTMGPDCTRKDACGADGCTSGTCQLKDDSSGCECK